MTEKRNWNCEDPEACRKSGYTHGLKGLMSMSPRCSAWSEGWRDSRDAKISGNEEI